MNGSREWHIDAVLIVRWLARLSSLVSIGLLLAFLFGEGGTLTAITGQEWLMLLFFPLGVIAGLAVGWWNEGLGGLIAVGSLAVFYLLEARFSGSLAGGPFFALFTLPGVLFLISWWLDHEPRGTDGGTNIRGAHS